MLEENTESGRRSIVFVHGRDFKPSSESLIDVSCKALRAGIQRDFPDLVTHYDQTHCEFAYYGDLSNALLQASGRHYDESLDTGDRRTALAALQEIVARKRFGIRQYDRLPGKSALGEFVADVSAPLLGAVGLWMWMCRRKSRDFAEYLQGDTDYSDKVRERLRARLTERLDIGDRILLLSHGTGSAVAWDVLWELSHDERYSEQYGKQKIELWVTLGAPLGDSQVRKRLAGAKQKSLGRYPNNIVSWHNVSAEDDYTCHDKTLADDLKKMMLGRVVSSVNDYKIYNHAIRYGQSNPHSSVGYYIHPRVSKIVADWLLADPALSTT